MQKTILSRIKKSLRAKFTLILLVCGGVPLVIVSVFFYYTAKDALFKNVFNELKWNADKITKSVEGHFADTGKNLVIASQNAAFVMYYLDPDSRAKWLAQQHRTLRYLRGIYPEMIDEACFIDASGQEISRIVLDNIAGPGELSSEEDRTSFFHGAFEVKEGEVFQARPTISEDTHRWVLPNATPIVVNGKKQAIFHFEINLAYFQSLLNSLVNPDRGYAFIINDRGEFIANTLFPVNDGPALIAAITADTPAELRAIYKRMTAAESGVEQFSANGKSYYIIFNPIKSGYIKGRNENRWSVGYVIPADRVYVEAAILRNNIMAVGITAVIVAMIAYIVGNYLTIPLRELARATSKVAGGEMPVIDIKRDDEIGALAASFNVMVDAIKRRDEALKALATTDGLTAIYNHRYFKAALEKEVMAALRFNRPLSLLMADVDWFKNYNDRNGHTQGDMALRRVADVFAANVREVDVAARYGGEEFAVILPQTNGAEAVIIAERIRQRVQDELIPFEEDQPNGDVTVSIGVATLPLAANDPTALIVAADKALYRAKEQGRNRVVEATADDRDGDDDSGTA
ncbi:MAG: diguanylate cyclase [Deltaproteobacteria bacterium]|nr:diguanylate cyclase [Deltaproteobacteria bacterium]